MTPVVGELPPSLVGQSPCRLEGLAVPRSGLRCLGYSAAPVLLSGSPGRWGVGGLSFSLCPQRTELGSPALSGKGGPIGPSLSLGPTSCSFSPAPPPGPRGHLREAAGALWPGALWCGARPPRGEGGSLWVGGGVWGLWSRSGGKGGSLAAWNDPRPSVWMPHRFPPGDIVRRGWHRHDPWSAPPLTPSPLGPGRMSSTPLPRRLARTDVPSVATWRSAGTWLCRSCGRPTMPWCW